MNRLLLVGDVGATKSVLALVSPGGEVVREAEYASRGFATADALLRGFLGGESAGGACLSVAGPVTGGGVWFPNLGWRVTEAGLRTLLGASWVRLVNDLEATAVSLPQLGAGQTAPLQAGRPEAAGVRAVIAAGTGLGQAMLLPSAGGFRAYPSEGGHADFAPADALQRRLLEWLQAEFGQVDYERVCSGQGIWNIYRFLRAEGGSEPAWLAEALAGADDPTPLVVELGLRGGAEGATAARALEVFAAVLGSEAGNLALRTLATGGVYLAGGMPPRLLSFLRREAFLAAFRRKGAMSELMQRFPVHVVLDTRAPLLGALHLALEQERRVGREAPAAALPAL